MSETTDLITRDAVRKALATLLEERRELKFNRYGLAALEWSHPAFQLEVDFTSGDDQCDIDIQVKLNARPQTGDKAIEPYQGLRIAFTTPDCRYEVTLTRGEPLRCSYYYLCARFEDLPLDVARTGWFELPPVH